LVVKPCDASLSHGLTTDIQTKEELVQAVQEARRFDKVVLVQQQVSGEEVRFPVLDGKCRAAIIRQTPRIVGDGQHTTKELLKIENTERENLRLDYAVYPQLAEPIVDISQLDLQQIPAEGEIIELGKSAMIRRGASAYNITSKVHPSYVELAEKLAAPFGDGFMVVDMFIQDYTQPLTAGNHAFLEYNMSPNLPLFYCCRDGQQYDILKDLVPMIDRALQKGTLA
jgi:cyanophycin synthetase